MKEMIQNLWQSNADALISAAQSIAMTLVVIVLAVIAGRLAAKLISGSGRRTSKIDVTFIPVLTSLTRYVIAILALLIILDLYGVNTTSVIALLGAAGIAVALALKDTLGHIAAGFMLLFLRPFKVDDFIQCSGLMGTVKEIGIFNTIMETPDGLYISAPNSTLWGQPLTNFTRNGKRRMSLVVGIGYDDSIETAVDVMLKLGNGDERIHAEPAPKVFVQKLNESSVDIELRVWANTDVYWDLYWEMTRRVKEGIEAAGLTIPFPQRVMTIAQDQNSLAAPKAEVSKNTD